jgi:phosphohistidine phosphatase
MDLYILRHGIAEDVSESGLDRDRVLTKEGIEKTKAAGKALRKLEVQFDAIFTSPYARARRTAEIVAEELELSSVLHLVDALGAASSAEAVLTELQKIIRKHACILVVGHEPILSSLISLLLSGSASLSIALKKGGLCKLNCVRPEAGAARLDWLLTAKHLCRMT